MCTSIVQVTKTTGLIPFGDYLAQKGLNLKKTTLTLLVCTSSLAQEQLAQRERNKLWPNLGDEGCEGIPFDCAGERKKITEPASGVGVTKWYRNRGGSPRNSGRKPKHKDIRSGGFRVKHIRHDTSGELIAFI